MTDLRSAAEKALKALEGWKDDAPSWWTTGDEKTITALRAALEQPEPPPEAQTEAEKIAYCAGWWAAMAAKAKEQPEQEPVAWVEKDGELVWCDKARATGRNLYIRPPRREWRGLTEEEIRVLVRQTLRLVEANGGEEDVEFYRAIEAALKEKNL